MIFYFYICLLFFDLVVLVKLVISLLLFISFFFAFLIPLPVLDFLCSCGALSCLCVIEFLSWPCSWFTLPGLAAYSATILLVDVQAIPVVFPSCLSVYSVLVVKSHANITTLLYLCFVINPWHSLTLQLGPPSRSLTAPTWNKALRRESARLEHTRSRALTHENRSIRALSEVSGLCHKTMNNTRPKWQNPDKGVMDES